MRDVDPHETIGRCGPSFFEIDEEIRLHQRVMTPQDVGGRQEEMPTADAARKSPNWPVNLRNTSWCQERGASVTSSSPWTVLYRLPSSGRVWTISAV